MTRLGFALVVGAAAAGPLAAASPNPKDLAVSAEQRSRAQTLVRKLASDAFWEREEAQEELAKMGRLAKPVLAEAAVADPDPEVRCRCRLLLPKAAAEDLRVRVETFLADADGKFEHDLPGWNQFRKAMPNTPAARDLFAEMLADETNRAILTAVGGPPGELGQLVAHRKAEFAPARGPGGPRGAAWGGRGGGKEPTPTDLAALLFAESQVPSRFVPILTRGPNGALPASVYSITALAQTGGPRGEVHRAIVAAWARTRDESYQLNAALNVAVSLELKETAEVAARLFATPGTASYRTRGASTLVQLEAKEQLPVLEKLLTDDAKLAPAPRGGGETTDIQVRDVALAACLALTGQEPKDYGFTELYPGGRGTLTNWFLTDAARPAAVDKWKAWRERNPEFGKESRKR